MSVLQDEDLRIKGSDQARDAGVMITAIESTQELIIIERSAHPLDKHKGQLSFPGGKKEVNDQDLMETAIRETQEEIGLELSRNQVLGNLSPLYIPVSNFMVHPFITVLPNPVDLHPDPREVKRIWSVSLDGITDEKKQRGPMKISSGLVLQDVPFYPLENKKIWGATAMILAELSEILYLYHSENNR